MYKRYNNGPNTDPWGTSRAYELCYTDRHIEQLLDKVFVIFGIIKVEVSVGEADSTYGDLDYSGFPKNRI